MSKPSDVTDVIVRSASVADAGAIARIYNYYVQNTVVTFEEELVSNSDMAARVAEIQGLSLPWLVAEVDRVVVGYAYANKWKGRSAYRYAVETTIYLGIGQEGRGVGALLYGALIPIRARAEFTLPSAAPPSRTRQASHSTRSWASSMWPPFARSVSSTIVG